MAPGFDNWQLLRAYVDEQDEAAFAQIVRQYVDLVYAAALRQTHGDRAMAEDVCQGVFVLLAQKAPSLRSDVIVPAYLLKATYFIARNAIKRETRRRIHERKAAAMSLTACYPTASGDITAAFSDMLDEGLNRLNDRDRAAIVLRFFEQRSLAEAGAAMGVSEDAAAMRVSRAVAKLRRFFESRRLTVNSIEAGAIISAIAARHATPPELAATATQSALANVGLVDVVDPFAAGELHDLAHDAAHEMTYQQVKTTLRRSALAAAVAIVVVGAIWQATATVMVPRVPPAPPAEVL